MNTKNYPFDSISLKEDLLKGLFKRGIYEYVGIQMEAIETILKGKDLILQSQSGSGKSLVFSVPILENIDRTLKEPQAFILSNTRELAIQSAQFMETIGQYISIDILTCIGGHSIRKDEERLVRGVQIISGTPGRVYDMINRQCLNTSNIKYLVLDEVDELLSGSFKSQIYEILSLLPKVQFIFVSATIPHNVILLSEKFMDNPLSLLLRKESINVHQIDQFYIELYEENEKASKLLDLLETIIYGQLIIFCNTIERTNWLFNRLKELGVSVNYLNSSMEQFQRESILKSFRGGDTRVLVTTELAGRGIDISQITHIINFDLPTSPKSYIHRIGRCGRFEKRGISISFVLKNEVNELFAIEDLYRIKIRKYNENSKTVLDRFIN